MKNEKMKYLIGGVVGASLVLFVLGLYSFTSADAKGDGWRLFTQTVQSFKVSDTVSFAGEKVDLTRYDVKEKFDREVISITYRHSYTLLSLKRANRFFPIIEPILKENGVPEDFKFLALTESNFDMRALSPVKAAGFWQLMPETAKELGLKVNDEVDERYDIEKATIAACKYLNRAYKKYGDWLLVAASYNAGMGRISRELNRQRVDNFFDMWLNVETGRYVYRILAIKSFLKEPQRYGYYLSKDEFYPTVRMEKLVVDSSIMDLAKFADEVGVPFVQLKELNPWLRERKLTVKKGELFEITVPVMDGDQICKEKLKLYQANWAMK